MCTKIKTTRSNSQFEFEFYHDELEYFTPWFVCLCGETPLTYFEGSHRNQICLLNVLTNHSRVAMITSSTVYQLFGSFLFELNQR